MKRAIGCGSIAVGVAMGIAWAAFAAGQESTTPAQAPVTPAENAAPPAAPRATPAAPAGAGDVSASDKYALIAERNIFYPHHEAAAVTDGSHPVTTNPQGASLLLTGVVQAGNDFYVVIQNTSTGESSIVTRKEASGAGEVVAASLDGVTLSTASGSIRVPVGYYLSGEKGPNAAVAEAGAGISGNASPEVAGPADGARPWGGMGPGGFGMGGMRPFGRQNGHSGDASGAGDAGGGRAAGGRGGGRRGGFNPQDMQAFRNMTPEQRDRMREAFMQMRQRGANNTGEGNQ